jgi:hypothetical protein
MADRPISATSEHAVLSRPGDVGRETREMAELVIDLGGVPCAGIGKETSGHERVVSPIPATGKSDHREIFEQIRWIHEAGYADAAIVATDQLAIQFGSAQDTRRLHQLVPLIAPSSDVAIETDVRRYRARNQRDLTIVVQVGAPPRSRGMVEMLFRGSLGRSMTATGGMS